MDAATGKPLATFTHEDEVRGAAFNHYETRLLTWSDDYTAVFTLPNPDSADSDLIELEGQVKTGTRLSASGQAVAIPVHELLALKREYEQRKANDPSSLNAVVTCMVNCNFY